MAELAEFIRSNRYPDIRAIARRLGCSVREAECLLARVRALSPVPLLYDHRHRGYSLALVGGEPDPGPADGPAPNPEPEPVAQLPLQAGEAARVDDPDAVDWAALPKPPPLLAWVQTLASVGVDVGSAWIKVVQVMRSRRGPVIVNLGLCPTPARAVSSQGLHAGAIGAALRQLLQDRNIVPWKALIVAGGDKLATAHLDFPPVPREELRGIMRWEAEDHLPFPLEEAIVDYMVLPDASETGGDQTQATRVFLVGARLQIVHTYEAALRNARLEPQAIDIEPLATHRAIRTARGWSDSPWRNAEAVLNLGWSSTSVTVFFRGSLEAYGTFCVGGEALTSALAARLHLTRVRAEQLKRSYGVRPEGGRILQAIRPALLDLFHGVERTLEGYLRRKTSHPVRRIYLVGGGARLPGLPEAVIDFIARAPWSGASARALKVEVVDPLSVVSVSRRLAGKAALIGPEFTTALGAAITGEKVFYGL